MSVHVKLFIAVLVLGIVIIVGAKLTLPQIQDALQRATSDAAATQGTLTVGMDSWVGYFPLCSPEMSKRMRAAGYAFRCEDDMADYAARFKKLAEGELDFATATVDAYVLSGAALDFPGAIIAVLDESKGGDAIVARKAIVSSLDALKRRADARIAFTPASPSEHLLKSIGAHFDLPHLKDRRGKWRVESDGSADALAKLQGGQADVAVLWEPDVSKALSDPALVKLIGTEDTDKLIVDVLLASRRLLQEKPEVVSQVLSAYFESLRSYHDDPVQLEKDVRKATDLTEAQVDAMLKGVAWASLNDNGALWFGVTPSGLPGDEGLVEAIQGAVQVLTLAGDFDSNPLPERDPYRLTNRQAIAELYLAQSGIATTKSGGALARQFKELDEAGWARLKDVGTLKIEPIGFQRGTATLDEEGRDALNRIAERLKRYPNYRVQIKGHTGVTGDAEANLQLSRERAAAAAQYLLDTYPMDENRLRAVGYGGSKPLPREPEESDRAYGYRLPRVELSLVSETY